MNRPLLGRRILVTRPVAQAGVLAQMIAERGGEPVLFPLIEIGPLDNDDSAWLDAAIENLEDYAIAVFISPNAVEYSVPRILERRTWPAQLQAAAIGPGTTAQLAIFGINEVIAPSARFDSESVQFGLPSNFLCSFDIFFDDRANFGIILQNTWM